MGTAAWAMRVSSTLSGTPRGMIARLAPVSREMILNYIAERVLGLPKSY